MCDNIIIKKIWEDSGFFEISITCNNKFISASTNAYVTKELINQLCDNIDRLLNFEKKEVFWKSGNRGNGSTPIIEFNIFMTDSSGHFLIECFMELNDGGNLDTHNCCFYVKTELGLLFNFNSKLSLLNESNIGMIISLLDDM